MDPGIFFQGGIELLARKKNPPVPLKWASERYGPVIIETVQKEKGRGWNTHTTHIAILSDFSNAKETKDD